MHAQCVGGEAHEVDDQVRVVASAVLRLRAGTSGRVEVVGQTVGDAVAGTQESVEQVEQFSDGASSAASKYRHFCCIDLSTSG